MKSFTAALAFGAFVPAAAFTASAPKAFSSSLAMADVKTNTYDTLNPFTKAFSDTTTANPQTTERTVPSSTGYVVCCLACLPSL
jgi:hypothetical protein